MMSSRQVPGNYKKKIENVNQMEWEDFMNPWNFYSLFLRGDDQVIAWLRERHLLVSMASMTCPNCASEMTICNRRNKKCGQTLRCKNNRNHEVSIRKYSLFDNTKLDFRDVMEFIRSYLLDYSLVRNASVSGIAYGSTAVEWAKYVREIFCEYVYLEVLELPMKFSGDVEIDECLFGRKWKFHRGKNLGNKVWVFGMVEHSSNRIILYPVDSRSSDSLLPLIQKHVVEGSHIFSDAWASYIPLNSLGYSHFSVYVVHTTNFKQVYTNKETGETVECHTNRIEGAWKHAKDHFQMMNGTVKTNFESHLCEIVWRNHHSNTNVCQSFFTGLKDLHIEEAARDFLSESDIPEREQGHRRWRCKCDCSARV